MVTLIDDKTSSHASDHVDLLTQLQGILQAHPAGSAVRLMFVPEELELGEDEVLVQHINTEQRTIELVPQKISELSLMDVVHDTQLMNPSDGSFNTYATSPKAASCLKRTNTRGQKVHIYD